MVPVLKMSITSIINGSLSTMTCNLSIRKWSEVINLILMSVIVIDVSVSKINISDGEICSGAELTS